MKTVNFILTFLFIFTAGVTHAAEIRVPDMQPNIQAAIDASASGDTIIVSSGLYQGVGNRNISFDGKAILLRSENGPENCIIDIEGQGSGFSFTNGEGSGSILEGFTIKNGDADSATLYKGGGIFIQSSSPIIRGCNIIDNKANYGAGIYVGSGSPLITNNNILNNVANYGGGIDCEYSNSSPLIKDSTIKGNHADKGAGIYLSGSSATISQCEISDNIADGSGGGIYFYNPGSNQAVDSCIIKGNQAQSGGGIGLYRSSPRIENSLIYNNTSNVGGGFNLTGDSAPVVVNCTFTENIGLYSGGAVSYYSDYASSEQAHFSNCIFWENSPGEIEVRSNGKPTIVYSNIKGGFEGEGNFHGDPIFMDPGNENFRLQDNSPCIYKGSPSDAPSVDIEGTLRPQGGGYDIGAYETVGLPSSRPIIESFTADIVAGDIPFEVRFECSANDPDGGSVSYTISYGDGSVQETNTSGVFSHLYETIGIGDAFCQAVNDSGDVVNSFSIIITRFGVLRVPSDYPTIQSAIDALSNGNTILVEDGIYQGEGNKNINFKGKAIKLKSENGPEHTVIDCEGDGRGFIFENGEGNETRVEGFTIINGNGIAPTSDAFGSGRGGGIYCNNSSPSILDCIIKNNSGTYGGGIYCQDHASPKIFGCIFENNTAQSGGGGMRLRSYSSPLISGCIFKNNTTDEYGGAVSLYANANPTIVNSIFSSNRADFGGAVYYSTAPTIINCTFYQNEAIFKGGGIYTEGWGAGIVKNSIFWKNLPNEIIVGIYDTSEISFSDVFGEYPGEGNFHGDPLFIDPDNNDFRLDTASPCLDAGTIEGAPTSDINGELRPMGGGVELGAHEIDFPADSRPVVESFVADVTKGMFPLTINFTCTAYDPNGQIVSYETNFGDGTPLEQSADGDLTHTYTKSGYYYATCTPVDNQGNKTNSKSIKLTIGIVFVPEDQVSIQNAIDFAPIHAIIIVNQGEYKESLQIDKPLSLKSLFGQRYTTLHAEQSDDHAISVNASNVIIDGFSIYGATETDKAGLYLSNSAHNCIIMNNRLGWSHNRNNNYGIFLDSGSSENQIINNALAYSDVGIFMENSDFNYISENICTLNSYGMVIQQSSGNHIENNTFNQNYEAGIQVLSSTSNFIRFNRFNNNKYGIYEQFSSNNTIDTNEFISIYISNHYIEKSPNKKVIPAIYLLLLN